MAQIETPAVDHPLDPLTAEEIEQTTEILEDDRDLEGFGFYSYQPVEPPKSELADREDDGEIDREVFAVLRDLHERKTYEAIVSLTENEVSSWEHVPDAEPHIIGQDVLDAEQAVKESEEFRDAARKRGVENFDLVIVDPWPVNSMEFVPEGLEDRRLARGLTWIAESEEDNAYARPIEGVHAFVDLDDMEVLEVVDNGVVDEDSPLPPESANYKPDLIETRDDRKHLDVIQPDGVSFEVDGRKVSWQGWEFRVGWTDREGLVFHDINYNDDGDRRKVLHRASVSAMAVPYGDTDPNHNWKNAFDISEFNVGRMVNSLTEGCDCLGVMHYFDAVTNDRDGGTLHVPNAICMHEEDDGLMWKHTEWRKEDETEVRRRRRLVVSQIATVYNYDYAFYWYFYQDGRIEAEVRLTGIDSNGVVPEGTTAEDTDGFYEIVAPQVKTSIHQHHFNFRLDFEVDGGENCAYEVHNQPVDEVAWNHEDSDNPAGQGWFADETLLETEQDARMDIDPLKARYWKIANPNETNSYGYPTAYTLHPGTNVESPMQPGSPSQRRAGFIENNFWVTPYEDDELYADGDYPNQNDNPHGLREWTAADRDLVEEDLVVWYTLGVNHRTRPEDWPVLPVEIASFELEPEGFFDENPAIDVPPEPTACEMDEAGAADDDD
ncbi:primary-amine oxidase [Natronococcus sp. A-GB1]|uniref:primary-amine oxidase n=1 Tax=Natronococcus sp. A-GB1 TaxID=3037648 RepID=UPI00241D9A6D|nr:primary-amine oxidase [Natronococcus sp. A-GB1]MDG5761784.1 primary-amine oxidase [Natronococcus sp. A-GB1]